MTIAGRIPAHRAAAGPANMALDEALLDEVAADPSFAYVRTYEWSEPTLSLGYFQKFADARADSRFRRAPIVRRATGGGALWHDREITYAVVVPARHPYARQARTFYRAVHAAIGRVVAEQGLIIVRRGSDAPSPPESKPVQNPPAAIRPFLCFADADADDLISSGVKIVGSAQRRRGGAVLQHGSILLTGSDVTPELAGVTDLLGAARIERLDAWSGAIVHSIAQALELSLEAAGVPDRVERSARRLAAAVYANPAWTERR